jgi:dTDP-D-glucose 4,6-dehydratase
MASTGGKLDVSQAAARFDWEAQTDFKDRCERTINWYEENRREIIADK